MNENKEISNFVIYTSPKDGNVKINVKLDNETIWLTQKQLAELFNINRTVITKHLKNIFESRELEENSTSANFALVQKEGIRQVERELVFYNLDVVIAVGYRANSIEATHFRIWATKILKEYIIKGFVLDDERLKQDKNTPIEELVARVKDIRTSEMRFYQKIRDVLKLSSDYRDNEKKTTNFFATMQNKLFFAIINKTAAEILSQRANHQESNMGLTSFKGDIIRAEDIYIAKNYLSKDEIIKLNNLVNMFLEYIENQLERTQKQLYMQDWEEKTNKFLQFYEYDVLNNLGNIGTKNAKKKVKIEYGIFDNERKKIKKQQADQEDLEELEKGIKEIIYS